MNKIIYLKEYRLPDDAYKKIRFFKYLGQWRWTRLDNDKQISMRTIHVINHYSKLLRQSLNKRKNRGLYSGWVKFERS